MSTRTPDVDALLRDANPLPAVDRSDRALDQRARDDLHAILAGAATADQEHATPRRPPRAQARSWRRRVALAGAVAAVTAAGVVAASVTTGQGWLPGVDRGVAYAATPAPLAYEPVADVIDPAALLRDIAAEVEALPEDTGQGRYAFVETQGWHLWTTVDGQTVTSEVVPQQTRMWRAADGSGRIETTTTREGARSEQAEDYGPGELAAMWPAGSLSADEPALADQLAIGHPVANGPAERLVAIRDAYRDMPLPPRVRAAMLRYLADTPGLEVTGRVTDRADRAGLAFSLESDHSGLPTRYTVIIDPEDGRLLGNEEMLTTTAGALNVPVPSVIGYTVYLDARYTDEVG